MYNPWSVINFVKALCANPNAYPSPYWANTSSNNIVKMLIEQADLTVKGELEVLIDGGTIRKQIHEDITYEDMEGNQDNLWNFLLFTGYLRLTERDMKGDIQPGSGTGPPGFDSENPQCPWTCDYFGTEGSEKSKRPGAGMSGGAFADPQDGLRNRA